MFLGKQLDSQKIPKHKVELHVHLEGGVRIGTIWDLCQQKNYPLAESLEDLRNKCTIRNPTTLGAFLKPIRDNYPLFCGDPVAIERIAYEFCEDAANQGILYAELRYSPHLMSSTHGVVMSSNPGNLTPRNVVETVNRGIKRGTKDFGVKIRTILVTMRGKKGWAEEVARLCHEFKDEGVVAMDIAGNNQTKYADRAGTEEEVAGYRLAYSLGVHRTVHAGEEGPAEEVKFAVDNMLAERIGHGYHVVDNEGIYRDCIKAGIHFEACPYSSILTGAVNAEKYAKHPIVRFAEDDVNFSINRDDPTVIQKTLSDDYDFLRNMRLTDIHFARANFNAARSSFLPDDEKKQLLLELRKIYGVQDN